MATVACIAFISGLAAPSAAGDDTLRLEPVAADVEAVASRDRYCAAAGFAEYRPSPDAAFRGFAEVGPFGRPVLVDADEVASPLMRLRVVPGSTDPGGDGRLIAFRIEREEGLAFDPSCFAATVVDVLDDPRSWSGAGRRFGRVDGDSFDLSITLASPATTDELCRPLRTGGVLSCRRGDRIVINFYRWMNGAEAFEGDLGGYRAYLINHEVGHFLGLGHAACPGEGATAPVMMQQTKGVDGCVANSWPLPGEIHG